MSVKLPRCDTSWELINTRTAGGRFAATVEDNVSAAVTVPFWLENTLGSTETVTIAGVTPLEGDTFSPAVDEAIVNGVLPPPGSVMVMVWVLTARLQKLPRNTMSRCEAVKRGTEFRLPTGRMVTPLSEIA